MRQKRKMDGTQLGGGGEGRVLAERNCANSSPAVVSSLDHPQRRRVALEGPFS